MPRVRRRYARRGGAHKRRLGRGRRLPRRPRRMPGTRDAAGGTTWVLNRQARQAPVHVAKARLLSDSITGANAPSSTTFWVDPSGTYTPSGFINIGLAEWSSYKALYDYYKVKSFTITFSVEDGTGLSSSATCVMYGRYQYDAQFTTTPGNADFNALKNVKVHTFTPEHPSVTYKVYARTNTAVFGMTSGVTSIQQIGLSTRKMCWCDVDKPMQIWGFSYYFPYIPTGLTIQIDISYDLWFKYAV